MVAININFEKRHLFILCIFITIAAGMFFAFAFNDPTNWGAANPANAGHSVDEIDWSKAIMKNIGIGSTTDGRPLYVKGAAGATLRTGAFINNNSYGVVIGAKSTENAGALQGAQLGIGYVPLLLNPDGANVSVGSSAPGAKLDVNGDIKVAGKINLGSGLYLKRISGVDPACAAGSIALTKKWSAKYCPPVNSCNDPTKGCNTTIGWAENPVAFQCTYWSNSGCINPMSCIPDHWAEVFCIGG